MNRFYYNFGVMALVLSVSCLGACGGDDDKSTADAATATDSGAVDTGEADSGEADSTEADTSAADTTEADTGAADTAQADTGAADGGGDVPEADKKAAAALEGMYKVSDVTLDDKAFDDTDPNAEAGQSLPFPAYGVKYVRVVGESVSNPGSTEVAFRVTMYRCSGETKDTCDAQFLVSFDVADGEVSAERRIAAVICDCKGDKFSNAACLPADGANCSRHWQQLRWEWTKDDDKTMTLKGRRLQCKTSNYGCKDAYEGTDLECQAESSVSYKSSTPKCVSTKATQLMTLTRM